MIGELEAKERAKQIVLNEGWGWFEPAEARPIYDKGKIKQWEIHSNILARGGNARIVIDAVTGDVLSKGWLSR